MTESHESRMLIDGKLVDSPTGGTFTNINPATEQPIGEVADATSSDMDRPSGRPGGRRRERLVDGPRSSGSGVSSNCRMRSNPSGRTTGRSWSRRSVLRS